MKLWQRFTDALWNIAFSGIAFVLGLGSMFLGAAYLTPALVGPPVRGSRDGFSGFVEAVVLFGSLFFGLFIAMRTIALLSKHLVHPSTISRLDAKFEQSAASMPRPIRSALHLIKRWM